ncbi:MAG: hypothetical protein J1E62_05895 [Lachnospiraceae bacterium]|nr:hypothetical protein [Lachnospiraceae bacterium]
MRKHFKGAKLCFALSLSICLTLCGCEKKETKREIKAEYTLEQLREESKNFKAEYPNLDLSKTKIIIPDGDNIEELIFPVDINIGESEENFEKVKNNVYENIRLLTGKDKVEEKYVKYSACEKEVLLKDVTKEDRMISLIGTPEHKEREKERNIDPEESKSAYGFMIGYSDGDYSTLLWGSSFMCEFTNKRVSGTWKKKYYEAGHRPPDDNIVRSIDISKDSIDDVSYVLDGKEVPLKNAIEYVEENIGKTGYHYAASPFLTYEVIHVDVIKYGGDKYYYAMELKALYKGIPFSSDMYAAGYPLEGEVDYEIFSETHHVSMLAENSMDFIWSSANNYEEKKEGEVYDKFLSIDDAMYLVSNAVSSSTTLHCDRVELLYRTEFHKDSTYYCIKEVQCHPVYQVRCVNTGLPDYPVLFFNVDAITGMVEGMDTLI